MAEEAANLTLVILREIRADVKDVRTHVCEIEHSLHGVRRHVASLDLRMEAMDEKFAAIREGTVSAIGDANARRAHVEPHKQNSDLTKRVEKLEAVR